MHESADDFKNAARSRARSGFGHLQRRTHADAKKTAFNRWRQFGQPTMQIVFRGANHFWWSATASNANQHDIANYYTKNWFDRWLKGDLTATGRLLSRTLLIIRRSKIY
jgi:hypothetical protein